MLPSIAGGLTSGLFGLAGGLINNAFDDSYEKQKEFAQNSLQWKAQDAKKAGFHPLAALGTNSMSYTPSGSAGGLGDVVTDFGQTMANGVSRSLDKNAKVISSEKLKQERLKTLMMEKELLKMGQAPQPTQAQVTPVKNSAFTQNEAIAAAAPLVAENKQKAAKLSKSGVGDVKHGTILIANNDGFTFVPSQEMSDGADATFGLGLANFGNRHKNPEFWYNVAKPYLPKPPKGYKWTMSRNVDGWNVVKTPVDEFIGQGRYFNSGSWEPNPDYSKRKWYQKPFTRGPRF